MVVIESYGAHRPWISGIFMDAEKANAFVESMDVYGNQWNKLVEIPNSLPFYVVEDFEGFKYFNAGELHAYLRRAGQEGSKHEDGFVCNVFTISQEFVPGTPGNDEMGSLPHNHLSIDELSKNTIEDTLRRYL